VTRATRSLYETDILAWSEQQAEALRRQARRGDANMIDGDDVIEEIEGSLPSDIPEHRPLSLEDCLSGLDDVDRLITTYMRATASPVMGQTDSNRGPQ
jgi:hypothetical protein